MKLVARSLAICLLIGLAAAPLRAEPPGLFRSAVPDQIKVLPAPASLDSEEMKAELQTVLRIQEARTDKEVERARADEKIRVGSFRSVLGPWATAENLPRLEALFLRVEKETKEFNRAAKLHFNRPRPLVVEPRIKPIFEETDAGYPSGHALRGQLFALLLADLAPDKAEALMVRGREIGWSRVIASVHFPSDVTTGRVLGQALAKDMLDNPTFRQELGEIRAEFDEARKRQTPTTGNGPGK
jgi:acid phosphatase (class A)